MNCQERASVFSCDGALLVGIISAPPNPWHRGVLVVVGGPQYRAGSHRQFTLLCRALAEQGIAAMRFDYRGMGDSDGEARTFEDVLPDIRAAIDQFFIQVPELREVALWGLCDAASGSLFYAPRDPRVTGLVLLNPWARTESGIAKTHLKHYYWSRFTDRDFWRKVARGNFDFMAAARSFVATVAAAFWGRKASVAKVGATAMPRDAAAGDVPSLPERMADGLSRFRGKVLFIMSGKDLTAQEFNEATHASRRWARLLSDPRVERRNLAEADHTFSRREWRDQVAAWTADWVRSW